jgi:hypothetical protein
MKKKVKRFSGRVASHTLAPLKMRAEWLMRIDFVAVREDKAWLRIQRDVPAALLATAAAP